MEPVEVKQVIIYRRDLKMRKGKIAAQVAHASMKVFFDQNIRFMSPSGKPFLFRAVWVEDPDASGSADPNVSITVPCGEYLFVPLNEKMADWCFNGSFAKIVLSVESEEDLLRAHEEAKARGIPTSLITDQGRTEFHGVPTNTTVAIGPAAADAIDEITGPSGLVGTKLA